MLGGIGQANRQYHRSKKLMDHQLGHQMSLNQHGHDLQMDMWNKTNYGAQVEHMKKAGLNPALMYGSAGQGGSTGSQTGGSASGGSATGEKVMDMQNMLLGAELRLKDALRGTEEAKQEDYKSQVENRGQDTKKKKAETLQIGFDNAVKEIDLKIKQDNIKQYTKTELAKWEELVINKDIRGLEKSITEVTKRLKENGIHNDVIATILEGGIGMKANELNEEKTITILGKDYTQTGREWLMWMAGAGYAGFKAGKFLEGAINYIPGKLDEVKDDILKVIIAGIN
jgi:hypothetical protein